MWPRWIVAVTVGAFVAAIAAAPALTRAPSLGVVWLLFVGSTMHVAATVALLSFAEVRHHARLMASRFLLAPLAAVTGAILLAVFMPSRALNGALLGYFAWQFVHYQKQNLGLAALTARAYGARSLTVMERRTITWSGYAAASELIGRPGLVAVKVRLPSEVAIVARSVGLITCLTSVAVAGLALRRRSHTDRPSSFSAIYLMGVGFPLPMFVFRSPYAAVGGMTIAHGLQYIVLVSLVTVGRRPISGRNPIRLLAIATAVLVAGAALGRGSHLHGGDGLARAGFGAYLGLVMTHFVWDAGLWRMRDEFPRRFISSRLPPPKPAMTVADASPDGVRSGYDCETAAGQAA